MVELNLEKESDVNEASGKRSITGSGTGIIININLLGYEVREEIEKSAGGLKLSKPVIISIALVGAAILLNIISYLVLVNLRDNQAELKVELESRKSELQAKDKQLTSLIEEKNMLQQKKNILNWAVGSSFKWSSLLEEVRDRTPSNLWVGKLDISEKFQLNISGETFDHRTVALFLANLQDSPMLTNVVLDFTKKAPKLKIRDFGKDKADMPKAANPELERMVTSVTKFNIRCEVIVKLD